jgi:predicted TIM-barrel fold metal-dependent hydrolase
MSALAIVDAHQHFWDLDRNYHPWLCDRPMIPFRYGDYGAIRRSYLPPDYRRDTHAFDVVATVHVEAEWNPADPVGETRWLQGLVEEFNLPSAVVAQAWLDRDDVTEVLAAQAAFSRVRGIRHKPRTAATPGDLNPGAPGSMGDPRWREGYALLEQHGLSFDLQAPWWHLREAAELARDFPGVQMILDHTGLPADRSDEGLDGWRQSMALLSEQPNVAVKISGLGVPGQAWTVQANRRMVLDTIDIFGVERCMFASNFPVDSLVADFETIYRGFMRIVEHYPARDQRGLLCDNARRIYRIS